MKQKKNKQYQIVCDDGMFVTYFHGGYAIGIDPDFKWDDKNAAIEAMEQVKDSVDAPMTLKEVA